MPGCLAVVSRGGYGLFGQPPEVLKALLKARLGRLDLLVLPDVRERDGVLQNNLEFLLYYFLFFEKGLGEGRRLKLIGEPEHISHVLELLRLTLLGPTEAELESWGTEAALRQEWLNSSAFFALKDAAGRILAVERLFEVIPFVDDVASGGSFEVHHLGPDRFLCRAGGGEVRIDLGACGTVEPPYEVLRDYVPAGLAKFSVEVLGGASGFSPEQPSTGFALCHNGNYLLIDAIPYVDWHLKARGIAHNQVCAMFLTHLHDDHCNMFPLMRMPRKLDVITTREIYAMAIRKLALGLGWSERVVGEHFNFVEVRDGEVLNYYGLDVECHHPVHTIPTAGAVFRVSNHGRTHEICLVGDVQTFREIAEMRRECLVRAQTETRLHELYRRRFDLLIADGGMGPIHGDPSDALGSKAERVVFVHVEALPEKFNATFSLAGAGKRYTIVEGDSDIYTTRAIEMLMGNFHRPVGGRWLGTLFSDWELKRYNTDDVIIKQGSRTWGSVFLILCGFCEVIHHDGERFFKLGTREAGELMGEMAVVTGRQLRNASVVARTPVMACQFSEEAFNGFLEEQGLKDALLSTWSRRPLVAGLPQFRGLGTTVTDALCVASRAWDLNDGDRWPPAGEVEDTTAWGIVCAGALREVESGTRLGAGSEIGTFRPHLAPYLGKLRAEGKATVLQIPAAEAEQLLEQLPQLNYALRKYRVEASSGRVSWPVESPGAMSGGIPAAPKRI